MIRTSNIYMFKNNTNGKAYVGQAEDVEARYKQHIKDSKNKDYVFYKALRKYGIDNFTFSIIEEDIPIENINEREIFWISEINSKIPNGYNMTNGGEGTHGYNHTEESKQKMREIKLGKKLSETHVENIRRSHIGVGLGKIISNGTKLKISISNTGKVRDEETKLRISETCKMIEHTVEWNTNVSIGLNNMKEENRIKMIENRKKTINDKKENGEYTYDCVEHFTNMTTEEKDAMYNKISKNNPRRKDVKGINIETFEEIIFHSIGEAGRWCHENLGVSKNASKSIKRAIDSKTKAYGFEWVLLT